MRLIVDELKDTLEQGFTIDLETRYSIIEFKPYLYMHNTPSGTFTLSILDSDENTVTSKDFTSSDIKESLGTEDNYAHVYLPVRFDTILLKGTYIVRLSSSGYTFNESSYLGWARDWKGWFYNDKGTKTPSQGIRILKYDKIS
jgi:hypothetical protein